MFGEDARRIARFPVGERLQVFNKGRDMSVDARVLQVGANDVLSLPAELVQRVQFGATMREPKQTDVQIVRESPRPGGCVAPMFVQQEGDFAAAKSLMDHFQERLKILLPRMRTNKEHSFARAQLHGAKYDATSIPAGNQNTIRLASTTPACPQLGKQKQIGFVFGQQDATRRQPPDFPADAAFFSRAPDPASAHIVAVSKRNPGLAKRDVSSDQKTSCPRSSAKDRGAKEPSN